MKINVFQCFFLRLRSFLACLVIHDGLLFSLRGTSYGMNGDVTELNLHLNIYHAPLADELLSNDQSVLAAHSWMADMLASHIFG